MSPTTKGWKGHIVFGMDPVGGGVSVKKNRQYFAVFFSTPGGNTLSAAEHTCALMCCLSR